MLVSDRSVPVLRIPTSGLGFGLDLDETRDSRTRLSESLAFYGLWECSHSSLRRFLLTNVPLPSIAGSSKIIDRSMNESKVEALLVPEVKID